MEETLQQDYAQSVTLQGMASRFHIDMSYLSTLFHEHTGKIFTSYLTDIRINHACEYLRTTTLSNAKIAQLCGFANDSYMKKVFRMVHFIWISIASPPQTSSDRHITGAAWSSGNIPSCI